MTCVTMRLDYVLKLVDTILGPITNIIIGKAYMIVWRERKISSLWPLIIFNPHSEAWNDNLFHAWQLLTGWDNSQFDITAKIICGIGKGAHKWAALPLKSTQYQCQCFGFLNSLLCSSGCSSRIYADPQSIWSRTAHWSPVWYQPAYSYLISFFQQRHLPTCFFLFLCFRVWKTLSSNMATVM